jgi:hypothetical protein
MRAAGAVVAADGGGGGGGGNLPLTGGTMQGDIDMGGFSIINATIDQVTTAVSATTASLGLAHRYTATAAPVTITISTADIVDGRRFIFAVRSAGVSVGTPVTIDTEGGELIDGAASIPLEIDYDSITLVARGGNLESE